MISVGLAKQFDGLARWLGLKRVAEQSKRPARHRQAADQPPGEPAAVVVRILGHEDGGVHGLRRQSGPPQDHIGVVTRALEGAP